uniref:Altered inheritance of mitochondria protein 24, mitochondrial n=1 Tax=Odontella aurita TaxID=265563 RepID=A0A7S4J9C2_9STRA
MSMHAIRSVAFRRLSQGGACSGSANLARRSLAGSASSTSHLSVLHPPLLTASAQLGCFDPARTKEPFQRRRYFSSTPDSDTPVAVGGENLPEGAKASSDGVVAVPIDFDVSSKVEGKESQIVTVAIKPGQILRAESGAMMYMTQGVSMNTTTGGGLSAGFKRMLTGQNVFISDYSYEGEPGTTGLVALGTDFPSKIIRLNVDQYGGKIVAQKGALLCATHTIDIEMEFAKKFSAGFFGGEGFVLQALTGDGDVFLKAGGTLIRRELSAGEQLRISSGCLVAFSDGVDFDIQTMPGFKNVMFGGEGLFVTTLTGPGTVWLQGQPPQRMISEIARRVPSGGGIGLAVPIGGMGGGGGDGGGESGDGGEEQT